MPRRDKKSPFYQFARLTIAPLVGEVPSAASALPSRVAAILAAQCDFYNDAARRVEILDEPHLAPPPLTAQVQRPSGSSLGSALPAATRPPFAFAPSPQGAVSRARGRGGCGAANRPTAAGAWHRYDRGSL